MSKTCENADARYSEALNALKDSIKDDMICLMTNIRNHIKDEFICSEVEFCEDDHFHCDCGVFIGQFPVDMAIFIEEQPQCEEGGEGVAFRFSAVALDGKIVGQCLPYNFTPEVWVSIFDNDAVMDRWAEFSGACEPSEVLEMLQDYKGKLND